MDDSNAERVEKTESEAKEENKDVKKEIKTEGSTSEVDEKPSDINEEEDDENEEIEDEESKENIIPPPKVDIAQLYNDPNFATICSFFNKFACMAGLKQPSFKKLEEMLSTYENNRVSKELIDLHVQMLRKIRFNSVKSANWEAYLKKYLALDPHKEDELVKLERYGYAYIPIGSKLQILKYLCESQIDFNVKLREAMLSSCRNVDLRLIPVGTDRHGLSYWYQQDDDCNVRLYTEEADDYSGGTWKLTAQNEEELKELIEKLETEDLGYDKKLDPVEKQKEKDLQAGKTPSFGFSNKRGTYLDTFIGEDIIKEMKESLMKSREEKSKKKREKLIKEAAAEESDEKEDEVEKEIPDELLDDRRVLPRRGASLRAATNMKKVLTPTKRSAPASEKKKKAKVEKQEKEKSATPSADESEEEEGDDEDDEEDEQEEESDEAASSGDEFKPNSVKLKEQRKLNKKLRKKKKEAQDDMDEDDDSDEEEEKKERKVATGDNACGKCKKSTDWEVLLLCDCCDDAWHTYCLKPVLWFVPDGDWFCPKCKHGRLIDRLKLVAAQLEEALKKKQVTDKKKQTAADRLKREMDFIGINYANIIQMPEVENADASTSTESDDDGTQRKCKRKAVKKLSSWNNRSSHHHQREAFLYSGRRSCRQRTKVDYKGEEFDQMINEAMENIDGSSIPTEVTKLNSEEGEEGNDAEINNELEPNGEPRKPRPPVKKVVRKPKLSDLDHIPDSDDGGDNYKVSDGEQSEEEFIDDNDSGSDFEDELPKSARRRQPVRRQGKRGGKRKRSWSGSSTEESGGEWRSGSDSDDYRRKKKKKKEMSESEGEIERTSTGRPLRKAVVKTAVTKPKKVVISDSEGEESEEEEEEVETNDADGKKKKKNDDDFEMNEDQEEDEEEEEEEEEIEDEESPEREGSVDEEEDNEVDDDDDSEEDGSNSDEEGRVKSKKPIKRMAGAPPSSLIGVKQARRVETKKAPAPKPVEKSAEIVRTSTPKMLKQKDVSPDLEKLKPLPIVKPAVIEEEPQSSTTSVKVEPPAKDVTSSQVPDAPKDVKPLGATPNLADSKPPQGPTQPWPAAGYTPDPYPPRPYPYVPVPIHSPYGQPPATFKGNGTNEGFQPGFVPFPPVSNPYATPHRAHQPQTLVPNPYGAPASSALPPTTDEESKSTTDKYLTL